MQLTPTTPEEVTDIIKQLKDSSPGHDDIHVKVFKQTSHLISPIVSKLINESFVSGVFPSILKIAKVIPIHKGGDKQHPSNYRPISTISTISKIVEKAMYNRLFTFLDNNNILSINQFGFRKNLSPQIAIVKLIDHILSENEQNKFTVAIFLT